jgi:imidazole glycerol phosphate synthase glutamine amidotransferase subunit
VRVTLIDYGAGNLPSVERAIRRLGAEVESTNHREEIASAERLILPGVGHCGALLAALDARGLRQPLLDAIERGVSFLGICLGLQALYESSEEAPELTGLGLLKGRVTHLPKVVKLPHMGWNQVRMTRLSRLLEGISPEAYFYFAHSYAVPTGGAESAAVCSHGREFSTVIEHHNIFGVQFHPEKSGMPGAKLLENFLKVEA